MLGSKAGKCINTYNSQSTGACVHTSIDTFNFPIKIEFEFFSDEPYYTGTKIFLVLFEDDQNTIFNSRGQVTGGPDGYGRVR